MVVRPRATLSPMRRVALLAAVVLVGVGAAFAFTGWNRSAATGLLLAGILCGIMALLASEPPRRER